jgi:hypothetical protein
MRDCVVCSAAPRWVVVPYNNDDSGSDPVLLLRFATATSEAASGLQGLPEQPERRVARTPPFAMHQAGIVDAAPL